MYIHEFLGRHLRDVMKLSMISWQIKNWAFPANYTQRTNPKQTNQVKTNIEFPLQINPTLVVCSQQGNVSHWWRTSVMEREVTLVYGYSTSVTDRKMVPFRIAPHQLWLKLGLTFWPRVIDFLPGYVIDFCGVPGVLSWIILRRG